MGVEVDRVGEVVPCVAVEAGWAGTEDVGARAVVAAPVVAEGPGQPSSPWMYSRPGPSSGVGRE
ncbi:hypothetical protein GCM10010345_18840 [Streptomyces canarius]|uniref:Uncharacterized protein n=1 Tax=Streptomyces canarius TaxID=285453 RepID=A0ABQ3CH07_9ACTN|nr:hypothetical protein GCM10010345_18840 [Streptomyces canarius]